MTDNTAGFSPEIRAMMGVYALYWKMDDGFDHSTLVPRFGRLESRLLIQLDRPRRMGELAQLLLTGPPSVTAAADRLEQMDLVRRAADPNDRRALLLQLTERGWAARSQLEEQAQRIFRRVTGLSKTEIDQFAALSSKIHETITGTGDRQTPPEPKGDKE